MKKKASTKKFRLEKTKKIFIDKITILLKRIKLN